MTERHIYDPNDGSWLTWRPLGDNAGHVLERGLGAESILQIGAFGTCGDPNAEGYVSWREQNLFPVLEQYGISESEVFNPEVGKWSPTRAPIEGIHLARDRVLAIAVTNQTNGAAGVAETGLGAYGGVLRGQDVVAYIEDNDESPEATRVARGLARSVLKATEAQYPLFSLVDNLDLLAYKAAISFGERTRQRKAGVTVKTEYALPPIRTDLDPTIYLSGTSGQRRPDWMAKVTEVTKAFGVSVDDSYRPEWSGRDQDEELTHKLGNAVHLVAVTAETEGLGALAELGPRLMYADLSGQSIGVYIEPHDSAPNSQSNRTRTLVHEHLNRLREDFPNLPVFVAKNLEQLAIFGLSEHFKQCQRLR